MAWHRVMLVAATAAAVLAGDTHAQACPDGQFSVSVLDNPTAQCLASRPCSGVYGPQGLVAGVGACPSGTGCALLPHNPSVMGCVIAGRDDVSYVNPDGSLTRGGVVIAAPPTTSATTDANSNSNTITNAGTTTTPGTTSAPGSNTNTDNNGNGNSTAAVTTSPTPTTNVPTPAHVKPGDAVGSSDDGSASKAPASTAPAPSSATPSASSVKPAAEDLAGSGSSSKMESSVTTTPPTSSSTPQANQQNALDDINGDIASNSRGKQVNGMGLGSIIAIVVGCLAVVAVIAGVFVLRKKKEQSAQTPVGGAVDVDDYGAACVTPKENVLLL